MSRNRRQAVETYHDRVAHKYDDIYDDLYWRWHDTLTWDYLKPNLPTRQSDPIIDLGCGTGKWGLKMARSGYGVTCLDISYKMVDVVRRKASESGMAEKVHCVRADLMDLSALPGGHFALATAFGEPLCSVDSPERALKQIRRLLKADGLLIGTIDNRLAGMDFYLERGDLDGLEKFIKTGRTHWLTKSKAEQFELHTQTPKQWTKLLSSAGFEVVELLGKTVLPLRRYREFLEDKARFRKLLALEKKLARDPDAVSRASHFQFVARKPA